MEFNNIVKLTKRLVEGEDSYLASNIPLTVYYQPGNTMEDQPEYDADPKVSVPFDIQIEYRTWGIKGIDVIPKGKFTFMLTVYKGDDRSVESEKEITVDFSKLDYEKITMNRVKGSGVTITDISVHLDKDANVEAVDLDVTGAE